MQPMQITSFKRDPANNSLSKTFYNPSHSITLPVQFFDTIAILH